MRSETTLPLAPFNPPQSKIGEITLFGRSVGATDLSQGFPDDAPPPEILALLSEAAKARGAHQYGEPRGAQLLRRNLALKLERSNGIAVDSDREVVVTCGATEGLMAMFRSLFQPGDHILTFAPAYENYFLQASAAGLQMESIELNEPDFAVTKAMLERALSDNLKAILICNPCNPTGKVFSRGELMMLIDFAKANNLLILSDETYENFIWRGQHVSVASLPGARNCTVTIASLGKTYCVTGWRIGYVAGDEQLLRPIARMHELTTFGASHLHQLALANALELPLTFYSDLLREYGKRKIRLTEALTAAGFTAWDPQGAYFLWCDYSHLSAESDLAFAQHLIRTARVAGVPGGVFFPSSATNPKRIRFTFSKSLPTINEAATRLAAADLNGQIHKAHRYV